MEMLTSYVKSLAIFMVFASFCQIIMPEGRLNKAVSMIMGIMLILIILKPVNAVLKGNTAIEGGIKANLYQDAEEYDDGGALSLVLASFESACENMLLDRLNADRVRVKAENGEEGIYIAEVTLWINQGEAEEERQKAAELCGIDGERVIVVINKAEGEYNEAD